MFNYRWVLDRMNRILSEVNEEISDERVEGIHSLANAGEWQLAFEILCENLQDTTVSEETYKMIQEVGATLSLDTKIWEILKPSLIGE